MKDLQDDDFDAVGSRLRNYEESPADDLFPEIVANVPTPGRSLYARTRNGIIALLFVTNAVTLYFLLQKDDAAQENQLTGNAVQRAPVKPIAGNTASKSSPLPATSETTSTKNGAGKRTLLQETRLDEQRREPVFAARNITPIAKASTHSEQSTSTPDQDARKNLLVSKSDESPVDSIQTEITTPDSLPAASGIEVKTVVKKKIKKTRPFYVLLGPSLSYQKVTPLDQDGIEVSKINSGSILSSNRLGISIQAGWQGRLSKKLEYYTGVLYYQQNQVLQYSYRTATDVVVENSDDPFKYSVQPRFIDREVMYAMRNVGAEAGFIYHIKVHKLSHKLGAGLTYQMGLRKSSESYKNNKSSYLGYQLFYRNEYYVSEKLRFLFQPSLNYLFHSTEQLNEPFTLKSYRAGLSVGLIFQL